MKTSIALIGFMGTGKTAVGKALAEKTNSVLEDKGLSEMLGKNAYASVEEKYSWSVVSSQIERVYQEAINEC